MRQQSVKLISPLSRGLPKTGQEVSDVIGDDGEHEAGWWVGRLNANNRTRFLCKTISGDDVVIDLATGLMWARDGNDAGGFGGLTKSWAISVGFCNALTFAGFTDWRLPNISELCSIVNFSIWNPAVYDVFQNIIYTEKYWSSTTRAFITTYAKTMSFSEGTTYSTIKTDLLHTLAVRSGK